MLSHALQPSFGGGSGLNCTAPLPVLVLSKGSCSSGLNCAHGGGPASPSVRRQLVQCWLDQHAAADTGEVDGSVRPGTDLQASIDRLATAGGGTLRLGPGRFELRRPLVLRSGVSIVGSGQKKTLIVPAPGANWPLLTNVDGDELDRIVRGAPDRHIPGRGMVSSSHGDAAGGELKDVAVSDLRIDCGLREDADGGMLLPAYYHETDHPLHDAAKAAEYRRAGRPELLGVFLTSANDTRPMRRIEVRRVSIVNCAMGLHARGVLNLTVADSEFVHNGMGAEHWHNLYVRRGSGVSVVRNLLANGTSANGINLYQVQSGEVRANLVLGNRFRGVRVDTCAWGGAPRSARGVAVEGNVVLESGELGLIVRECEGGEVADDNFVAGNGRLYHLYHPSGFKLGLSANIPYCADECDVPLETYRRSG